MIHVEFSYTVRSPHPSSQWTLVHEETRTYPDLATAKAKVKEQYWHSKRRTPVYHERHDTPPVQSGWVYSYKEKEDGKTYYHQDWVTYHQVDYRVIDMSQKENR